MKKIYLLIVLVSQFGIAQAPAIEWQKCLGGTTDDVASSIQQTTDGGYILAGYTRSNNGDVTGNHGNSDYWVVKLAAAGTIQWQKTLGGTEDEYAYSIQQTTDGGYIVAGYTLSNNGNVTGNHGNNDYWIVKLSATGTIEWQKALGGTQDEYAESIQQTRDGGYIVAGYTNSNNGDVSGNHGGIDMWIVKLATTGTIQWQKTLGGTYADGAYGGESVKQTSDGGYIVAGFAASINGDVTGHIGALDYWIVKLTNIGTIEWQKSLGGTASEMVFSINQSLDGGYIVAGTTQSNDGDVTGNHGGNGNDAWIVKLSTTGTIEWEKTIGGTNDDYIRSIKQNTDGSYIAGGYTFSNDGDVSGNHSSSWDLWVVKFSNTGTIQWQKALGGTAMEGTGSIQQTSDGGYITAGSSNSLDGDVTGLHQSVDAWVVKLGPDALSTTTFAANSIKIFPNPTSSVLTVQGGANLLFDKMIVTDLAGKAVLVQEQNTNQINVEKLASGMYILQAFAGEDKFVSKFVKE